MRRGTTPKHTFTLPFNVDDVDSVQVIYRQDMISKVVKAKSDCILDGNNITVTLSQEETLRFTCGKCAYVQIRVLRKGMALASEIIKVLVDECLENEVIE